MLTKLCGSGLISLSGVMDTPVASSLNPQEDAKFLEFSKRAEGHTSRARRLSKNVSWSTHAIPCIRRQSRIVAMYASVPGRVKG